MFWKFLKIKTSISHKIGLLLFMMFLMATINVVIVYRYQSQQKHDSHIVNIAGRQRMLSQRIAKLALSVADSFAGDNEVGRNDKDRMELLSAISRYDSSLSALWHGGFIGEEEIPPAPKEMEKVLAQNDGVWSNFKVNATVITARERNSPGFREALFFVMEHNDELLAKSDLVTQSFDRLFSSKVIFIERLLLFILGVDLIVFIIGFLFVNQIVRPIVHLSNAVKRVSQRDFTQSIDISGSRDEVGQLIQSFNRMVSNLRESENEIMEKSRLLGKSEERLRSVVETAGDAIIYADSRGNIIFWNTTAESIFGYSAKEIVGKSITTIMPERFREAHTKSMRRVAYSGKSNMVGKTIELMGLRKDGSEFPIELSIAVWKIGEETFFTGIMRNITERKKAEEDLRKTAEELAYSNAELRQFAYVASHDLQEPLRMVGSYTQLLARRYKGKLDHDADEFIGYAMEGVTRIRTLINDLLMFFRIGTRESSFKSIDCTAVLDRELQNLKITIDKNNAVVTYDSLPIVTTDEVQLGQVFQNLIGNAIKFHNEKAPEIHIGAERNNEQWVFSVSDNGIGIDREYYDRVFVIFQRLNTREEYSGTGIGLAICKKIIERHGGKIWLESKLGKGTTFYFTIPVSGNVIPSLVGSPLQSDK